MTRRGRANSELAIAPRFTVPFISMCDPMLDSSSPSDPAALMDRMYRRQRHIYDFTRKFYLLGRDEAITRLRPAPGDKVLEIGCGTGRNLIKLAQAYPEARLFGLD